jgi:hypothetical protein
MKRVNDNRHTNLTKQEAVEMLAYVYPERKAYMRREPCITNGARWVWFRGKLWLQGGIGAQLVPPRPCMYPEALVSRDWVVYGEPQGGSL